MKIWQRFKNWIIKHLGGWTDGEYREKQEDLCQLYDAHIKLHSLHAKLAEEYKDCRDTLAGLEILKTKIETFQAKGAFPYSGRNRNQLRHRIAEKKTAVVNKLVSDILQQERFFVIEVNEESNKVEVSATISVLEGGVIGGKEAQLPQDGAGAGDSRKSGETPQDD